MSRPSRRISIAPKSTHHEHPTVRAVQYTASSRTLAGSFFDAALQQRLVHGVGDQQSGMWCAPTANGTGTSPNRRLA